ncbi:WD40/YVTN/BNR-like repeat-containing protein [Pseudomonas sp.]|uniref:WD40/YVTN/BNR-like repeat-containing protein n=1 Tax=Pseudomonas sp. TaxID=306 RepID=UPI0039C9C5C5
MIGNFSFTRALPLLLTALLLPAWSMAQTAAQSATVARIPLLDQPALQSAKAPRSVLLAVTRAGERLVAVGERGIVLLSDDSGASWRQAKVPASVSLTSVQFVDAEYGWAVGHLGVVLHSTDGGETWSKQLDGIQAAQLALAAAQQSGDERLLKGAEWLVADGPDKPFLDLYFSDRRHGYIVGAYGLILRTTDGGASWQSWMGQVENPEGLNLYAIDAQGGELFIAGERGLLLRSSDAGQSFQALASPYEGSFFGLLSSRSGGLLAYGLRGNAWWSSDRGDSWQQLDTGLESALAAGIELADGSLLLASQSGELLLSDDSGRHFEHRRTHEGATVAAVEQAADGSLTSVGLGGLSARQEIQAAARP